MARILHLISADQRRGAETFAVELAAHLRSCGHTVEVLAVHPSGAADPLPVRAAGRSRTDPVGFARIVRAARDADVVVSFGSSSLAPGAAAARMTRRPFVYRNIGDPSVWGRVPLADLRVGAPIRRAAAVVALYPEAARVITERYRVDTDRFRVIPRGVSTADYPIAEPDERTPACRTLGLDPDRRWLAYVGSLSEEKDPLLALRALERLDGVGLCIAGDGPLRDEVERHAARLGDRVAVLGTLDDVRPVYAACDALVLPSRTEGTSGAAIEAALSGRPTVAFAVGGNPQIIEDRRTGRLVERREAVDLAEALADTLDQWQEWGRQARTVCATRFSMESVGSAWADLIDDLHPAPTARTGPRVLHVVSSTQRRGAEVFAIQLAPELDRLGQRSTVAALEPGRIERELPLPTLGSGRRHPATLLRLARAARRHDVVVAHGGPSLLPVALATLLVRRPFVYRNIGDPTFWGEVPRADLRIGTPARRAAAIVSLFPAGRASMIERYDLEPSRVTVIPNAVPDDEFEPATKDERSSARAELGVTDDRRPVIGYLGSLSHEKRPHWMLEIAARLPSSTVVVAGSGTLADDLRTSARQRGLANLSVAGTSGEPRRLLAAFDVLALPSRTEGIPAVVIEAALMGVPTVATDVGAVRTVLTAADRGTVVGVDDLDGFVEAVRAAIASPAPPRTRTDLSDASTSDASLSDFTIHAVAPQWDRLLRQVAAGTAPVVEPNVGDQPVHEQAQPVGEPTQAVPADGGRPAAHS